MRGLLERLALVRCRDLLQAKIFPLTSQPVFTIRHLLNASGQLHQGLLSIRDQYRQVKDVPTPSFLFSQGRGSLLNQLFHLQVERRKHLLPLRTFLLERGQRSLKGHSFRRALLLFLGEALEFLPSLTLLLRIEFLTVTLDFRSRQRPRLLLFNL